MGFFEFPHTRTYDSDLGWLIRQCKTNMDAIAVLEEWKNVPVETWNKSDGI